MRNALRRVLALLAALACAAAAAGPRVTVRLDRTLGPMEIERYGVGQGGASEKMIWADRVPEIRALRPHLIRLFVMEFYDLLPAPGRYDFTKLDEAVDVILRTGATPLMCITFKPRILFPRIDLKLVEPNSYPEWEALVYNVVRHYKDRGAGIRYWEVGNEGDIASGGGAPYSFTPDNYTRYYQHTAAAILRADPAARVGGAGLGHYNAPMLPALLEFCASGKAPLHFVSWHLYDNRPARFRETIDYVRALVAKYPSLKPETILDEWNMSLGAPETDPRFQPCFIAEVTYQMKEGGLDRACYYHIRDDHFSPEKFKPFYPGDLAADHEVFWNRMPVYLGLFDFQNRVRPAYFMFKLLSRLTGERLAVEASGTGIHALASYEARVRAYSVLLWNFSPAPAAAELVLEGVPGSITAQRQQLDATGPHDDETARLRPLAPVRVGPGRAAVRIELEPYGVIYWSLQKRR